MSRLEELLRVARAPTRRIVGLMSGTSLDGIDAALCDVSGSGTATRVELVAFETFPYPPQVRRRVLEAIEGGSPADVCELDFVLGEVFAEAVEGIAARAGVPLGAIDLVASHGQTVWHVDRTQGETPSTLQIGQAAVIAERTGRIVVSDFRPRDIAAGGGGAPLVAWLDHCLFARPGRVTVLLNVGGIANLSVVTERPEEVLAFDTGPGNLLVDEVCRELLQDEAGFDQDGQYSALGEVDPALLERLLAHEYLHLPPPKTTGREVFGVEMARRLIADYDRERLIDLLATVVRFTAASIGLACREHVLTRHPRVDELLVSGGGAHNRTLLRFLGEELPEVPLRHFDQAGLPFGADAKEAVAFALLANETVQGLPSNVPAATGARRPALLGKITL